MRRMLALASALLLLASLAVTAPRAAAEQDNYFIVVQFTAYPFGGWNEPVKQDGRIMVPLHWLADPDNGLGLRYQWSSEDRYLTLYDGRGLQLTFEYGQGTAFSGETRYTAPLGRFGSGEFFYFVPIDLVCDVFDLYWGETPTEWGTMVRVHSVQGQVSNEDFAKSPVWNEGIRHYYALYMNIDDTTPSPSPGASPAPPPASPSPTPAPPPELMPVPVYLTFDGGPNEATGALLDFLERRSLPALFFLPPEGLGGDPALLRRIVARHQAGLLLDVPEGEALPDAVRDGNALLREAALVKTWLIRTDNAPAESTGCRFWGYTLSFSADDSADDIVTRVEPLLLQTPDPAALVLSLPHSAAALEALETLSRLFAEHEAVLRRVNPGALPAA